VLSGSGRTATDLSMPIELPGLFRGCQRRMQQTDDVLWYEPEAATMRGGFEAKDAQISLKSPTRGDSGIASTPASPRAA
jgi:hypothetical protein